MSIFILLSDSNHCQNIVPANESDWSVFRGFNGEPFEVGWKSPRMLALCDKKENNDIPESDFPALASHIPVFSRKALDILGSLIKPYGEFLKLAMDTQELYAFNVTKLVDALDISNSECETFRDGKRIIRIRRHVFKDCLIDGLPVFKLAQLPLMYVYVSDIFADLVKENNLTGFIFHPADKQR